MTCRRPRLPLDGPRLVVLQPKHCASMGNPQRSAATVRTNRGTTPRAPLDASGGCLVTGDQRLRSPEEVRLRFGPPQRRRTPMRVKMGAGQIWGRKISLGSGDPCHQPGSTHPGGGKANYFKPARGGPVLLVERFRGGVAFPRVFV